MGEYPISVLGVGDNVVDKYEHIRTMYPGGNTVNFAVFAKKLGVRRSAYMGIFGSDQEAEHVICSLQEEGVELIDCRQVAGANGATRVTVDAGTGERIFLGSNEGGIRRITPFVLDHTTLAYVKEFDLVHSGNYSFTENELPKIKEIGVPISFDFSDDSTDEYYKKIAPLVDFAFMSCGEKTLDQTKEHLRKVSALGPELVCASRGTAGSIAYDGKNFYKQGIEPVEVMIDTMAAGDSLLTAFLVNYISAKKQGQSGPETMQRCLEKAAAFAAHTCGVAGSWGHGKIYE